jgi:hypothetical protein
MKRIVIAMAAVGVALLLVGSSGCTSSGYGYTTVGVSATYSVPPSARLAYVGDGLWVVTDQPYPTFFSDGFYWLYTDNIWYRSPYYDRGWVRVYQVPQPIYRIDQPTAYVQFSLRPGMRWYTVRDYHRYRQGDWRQARRDWRDYRYRQRRVYRTHY